MVLPHKLYCAVEILKWRALYNLVLKLIVIVCAKERTNEGSSYVQITDTCRPHNDPQIMSEDVASNTYSC